MEKADILQKRIELGRKLRDNREAYNITISDLSVHSGLTIGKISLMERGKIFWTLASEIKYMHSLQHLIEAQLERRKKFPKLYPPVKLDPDKAIFTKYL